MSDLTTTPTAAPHLSRLRVDPVRLGARAVIGPGLALLLVSVVAVLYRDHSGVQCTSVEVQNLCSAIRGAPHYLLALAAGTILFLALDARSRAALSGRLLSAGLQVRGPALQLLGAALALAPVLVLSADSLAARFPVVAGALIAGGLAIGGGALVTLMPGAAWIGWLKDTRARIVLVLAGMLVLTLWFRLLSAGVEIAALTDLTYYGAAALLLILGQPVTANPDLRIFGIGEFHIDVIAACSGIEGLLLVTAAAFLFAIHRRGRLRQVRFWLLLLPAALIASLVLNIVRIALLVVIGAYVSPTHALNGFHDYAGWIAFSGLVLGIVAAGTSRFFTRS
jgi:exosortase E/protease (VPEID-CTERM system)